MYSKLTFGQKLGVWLGCAIFIVIGGITAICFQLSKSPPKDMDKLIPKWARQVDLQNEEAWKKAEEFSSLQIEQNPKSAFWYRERGYARWWLKKYDPAIADLTEAIRLDPTDSTTYAYRGELLSYQKKHQAAIEDLTKAIELSPKSGRYYYSRGAAYDWLKDVDKAFADYDKAIELNYDLRKSHLAKGNLNSRMKNFDAAISEYELGSKALCKDTDDNTLDLLTRLYVVKREYEKAKNSSAQWIEETHSDRAYRALISICKGTNDTRKMKSAQLEQIEKLTERILEEPEMTSYYGMRGDLYKQTGNKKAAEADYEKVFELDIGKDQDDEMFWKLSRRARICERAGKHEEAIKLYKEQVRELTKEIAKQPKENWLYIERAHANKELKNYKAASIDFEKAKNSDTNSSATTGMYELLVAEKHYEQALDFLKKTESSNSYRLFSQQAKLFEKMGKHQEAIDAAHKAMDINITNSFAYYWLGKALTSSGKSEEGQEFLKQSIALGYEPKDD